MLEKLIELCKNKYITFEISTWHSLTDGKNRLVVFGAGKEYLEFFNEDVFALIEMAINAIEEHEAQQSVQRTCSTCGGENDLHEDDCPVAAEMVHQSASR